MSNNPDDAGGADPTAKAVLAREQLRIDSTVAEDLDALTEIYDERLV